MVQVLEAVPNFSEGRDLEKVRALVETIAAQGVDVLDSSSDADHHRSVVTYIGDPRSVKSASVAAAEFALEHLDVSHHQGLHPRIGALDVLPFVPLEGLDMRDAVAAAHDVGQSIASLGIPVFYYGQASEPRGRGLAELRRGGFEALKDGFPADRTPDLPPSASAAHPTAGVTCVGARDILLAWNVFVGGIGREEAIQIASEIRERDGGFPGVRALGLYLAEDQRVQISMNLEDPERTPPSRVYEAIERAVLAKGGQVLEIEVIGMMPDALVLPETVGRLDLPEPDPARVLSRRVAEHVHGRQGRGTLTPDNAI